MLTPRYRALTNAPFLLAETTQVLNALQAGETWADLRLQASEGRLFGMTKASTQLTHLRAIKNRLSYLTQAAHQQLVQGSLAQRQLLNLALVAQDREIMMDFLAEEIVRRWSALERRISDSDVRAFLTHKAEQSPEVAAWSVATVRKTQSTMIRFLEDAGILKETGKGRYDILPQYLSPETKGLLTETAPQFALLMEKLK